MQIIIDIPKEFEKHFNFDNFEDSLERIKLDVVNSIYCTEASLSGKYEIETIDMLIKAFKECTPLPKGYGRLIDVDEVIKIANKTKDLHGAIWNAQTIIEAECEDKE